MALTIDWTPLGCISRSDSSWPQRRLSQDGAGTRADLLLGPPGFPPAPDWTEETFRVWQQSLQLRDVRIFMRIYEDVRIIIIAYVKRIQQKVSCLPMQNDQSTDDVTCTYPDYTVQNTYELIAWNKNEKSWLLAHLLGTTLKNEQLLYDDWLVNFSNEPLEGLLTCLSFLCTELLRLKYWKHPHCRHFHGPMPWSPKKKADESKKFGKNKEFLQVTWSSMLPFFIPCGW